MAYKQTAFVVLLGLACVALGHFLTLHFNETHSHHDAAPKIYVARCGFHFSGESCGEITRKVTFLSSDELLSYTDNWAVGRTGSYKSYISCFEPGDETYIDGTFSSLTVIVSGPELVEAHEISRQLMVDFSDLLSETGDSIAHCIKQ